MFELSRRTFSDRVRRLAFVKLAIFSSPLVGAYFYSHGKQISFLVCPCRYLTGIPCPGCGMTRSFVAIAQGDWHQAIEQNLFGPVLFASFLVASIHLTIELVKKRQLKAFYSQLIGNEKLQLLGLVVILIYHGSRLYKLSISGELSVAFLNSPLGKLLF